MAELCLPLVAPQKTGRVNLTSGTKSPLMQRNTTMTKTDPVQSGPPYPAIMRWPEKILSKKSGKPQCGVPAFRANPRALQNSGAKAKVENTMFKTLTLIIAAACASGAAMAASIQDRSVITRVSHANLGLSTAAIQQQLRQRVWGAVSSVCADVSEGREILFRSGFVREIR
jgi:UrcA family protein